MTNPAVPNHVSTSTDNQPKTVIIVGGVAGGASCAARMRRLDEDAQIIMVERGPHISFANCGLPYHIGGVIEERDALLVQTPESFKARFNIDVRVLTEAFDIDPDKQRIALRDVNTGQTEQLAYDALVLSPGATPFVPPIKGADLPGVFALRNIPDMDRIIEACDTRAPHHVTVVGAGFIGLEVAENMVHRGIEVTVIEMGDQVMPNLDFEMAAAVSDACRRHGIDLRLSTQVVGIESKNSQLQIESKDGDQLLTDLVVMAVGVRPEVQLARAAGLELGDQGGIAVDDQLRTSNPSIFAIGDAIEIPHRVSGATGFIPLAGPANRQGRLVADIIAGQDRRYGGALGTSIIQVFDITAACTGLSEAAAQRHEIPHRVAWVSGHSHASYYPGSESVTLKAIFDPQTGLLLGAQGFGRDGVDKRIDILATAISAQMTVDQLEALDLAYAPPFSSAKDPVNHLGALAWGMVRGQRQVASWRELVAITDDLGIVDVRSVEEFADGTIPGAINIPLNDLRQRLDEVPTDQPLVVLCKEGLRGYLATRILNQHGFEARNLLGGYHLWNLATPEPNALIDDAIMK